MMEGVREAMDGGGEGVREVIDGEVRELGRRWMGR